MGDADRAWRFDRVGIVLASGWFEQTPDYYTDRLEDKILPELITEAAIAMAHADLKRSRDILKTPCSDDHANHTKAHPRHP